MIPLYVYNSLHQTQRILNEYETRFVKWKKYMQIFGTKTFHSLPIESTYCWSTLTSWIVQTWNPQSLTLVLPRAAICKSLNTICSLFLNFLTIQLKITKVSEENRSPDSPGNTTYNTNYLGMSWLGIFFQIIDLFVGKGISHRGTMVSTIIGLLFHQPNFGKLDTQIQ